MTQLIITDEWHDTSISYDRNRTQWSKHKHSQSTRVQHTQVTDLRLIVFNTQPVCIAQGFTVQRELDRK